MNTKRSLNILVSFILILVAISGCVTLNALKYNKIANRFISVVTTSIRTYDSIRYFGKEKREYGSTYVIKILDAKNDLKSFSFSITSIVNKHIPPDIQPFYFCFINDDVIIIRNFDIFDSSYLNSKFYPDTDYANMTKDKLLWINHDFDKSSSILVSPSIGFYSYHFKALKMIGEIKYFIAYPLASVPKKYRPVIDYKPSINLPLDSTGHYSPYIFKDYFNKHIYLEDMYDHEIEIKFGKDGKIVHK